MANTNLVKERHRKWYERWNKQHIELRNRNWEDDETLRKRWVKLLPSMKAKLRAAIGGV